MAHKGPGMIVTVLKWLVIFIVIGLIAMWLIAGGWAASMRTIKALGNPVEFFFGTGSTTLSTITLPWGPGEIRGPDISGYADEANRINGVSGDEPDSIEAGDATSEAKTFGNPSPYSGKVSLRIGGAKESDAASEYVELNARGGSTIDITGWSLQSAATAIRMAIPYGTSLFVVGVVNAPERITLRSGDEAIINTGISPVGISMRENICSGYLSRTQVFTPELSGSCPSSSDVLPLNEENIRTYGATCFDYLASASRCSAPSSGSQDVSPACRSLAVTAFTYNGCVQMFRGRVNFSLPSWRVYLGLGSELWGNSHDVIRLLDAEGRTVTTLTY